MHGTAYGTSDLKLCWLPFTGDAAWTASGAASNAQPIAAPAILVHFFALIRRTLLSRLCIGGLLHIYRTLMVTVAVCCKLAAVAVTVTV